MALNRLGLFEDRVRVVLGAVSVWGWCSSPEGTPKTYHFHRPMGVASIWGEVKPLVYGGAVGVQLGRLIG